MFGKRKESNSSSATSPISIGKSVVFEYGNRLVVSPEKGGLLTTPHGSVRSSIYSEYGTSTCGSLEFNGLRVPVSRYRRRDSQLSQIASFKPLGICVLLVLAFVVFLLGLVYLFSEGCYFSNTSSPEVKFNEFDMHQSLHLNYQT